MWRLDRRIGMIQREWVDGGGVWRWKEGGDEGGEGPDVNEIAVPGDCSSHAAQLARVRDEFEFCVALGCTILKNLSSRLPSNDT
ncbi:hypothetical protein EVAR_70795_1 [Eumeta japonica]|uniref:Uncharacterized protein n=1 Tax=Eumeta variegata TaxID=151549 RepID=A0A4C1SWR6_EUMVA|nr:hypothetical protein EVAR_70795_1 [Eumeta japonica]